jgi:hypothetical protein
LVILFYGKFPQIFTGGINFSLVFPVFPLRFDPAYFYCYHRHHSLNHTPFVLKDYRSGKLWKLLQQVEKNAGIITLERK